MMDLRPKAVNRTLFSAALATILAACSITPETTLMSRSTGEVGKGTVENVAFGNSGPMTVTFSDETFQGEWVAVRNPGSTSFNLITAYGLAGGVTGTSSQVTQADSGYGTALLSSNKGNSMRCEYRYSLATVTATGVCKTRDGEVFDLQMSVS